MKYPKELLPKRWEDVGITMKIVIVLIMIVSLVYFVFIIWIFGLSKI